MNRLTTILIWIGGGALLAATAVDSLAVIGRQVGIPLRGSIELIQPAILTAGAIAILVATIAGSHARAIVMLEQLGAKARRLADGVNDALTALFYLVVLAGSLWLAADLWAGHEVSEIVGVPWRWMRLIANVFLLLAAIAALARIVRTPGRPARESGRSDAGDDAA